MAQAKMYDFALNHFPSAAPLLETMNATTAQNTLYPGINIDGLNWLQQFWANTYIAIGNPLVATGVMSFTMNLIVYFGRCIPWIIIDAIPYFRQWKLQPGKVPTPEQMWKCTKYVILVHFTMEAPLILVFHPICEYFGMATYSIDFTPIHKMIAQIAFFFVFEDMFHYFAHRALHWGPLYKNIHKMHHEFSAPFGLAAEYSHPLEVLILAEGTLAGPLLYCLFRKDLHILTVYAWIVLRQFQAVDAHSGYDFPWSLRHFLPFWAGADHHDFHHMAFVNCYSTSFRWWDFVLGTDNKYHAYKARVAAAKPTDRKAVEKKELEEVEREGLRAERLAGYGKGEGGMEGVPKGKLE